MTRSMYALGPTRRVAMILLIFVLTAGCSSAGLPGADEALEQIGRAERVTLELDLTNASRAEEAYFAQNDTYTTDVAALGVNSSEGVTLTIPTADTTTYCVQVTDGQNTMHLSKENPQPGAGPC